MLVSRSRVGFGSLVVSLAWLLAVQACGSETETEGAAAPDGGGDEPLTPEADGAPSGKIDASSPRDAAPEASAADAASSADAANEDASAPTGGVKCASWNVETIFPIAGHSTTGAGDSTSLAFDAAGAAHVAFSTNLGLYYGTNASGAWVFELVPSPRPVVATTIALGAQGRVDIVYYEGEHYDVRQVSNATGSWVTTVVAETGIVGEDLTLATDAQGRLHIAFLDGTRSTLVYGVRNGDTWTLEDAVTNTPGRPVPSLLLDGTTTRISFGNYQQGLKLASRDNAVWSNLTIAPGSDVGGSSSIAKDGNGALHITYSKFRVDNSELRYATNASGTWESETLDDQNNTGFGTTLLERGGVLHVAYVSASPSGALRYAAHDASGWTTSPVSEAAGYSVTSMLLDQAGRPVIAFKRGANAVGLARCQP